MLRDYSEKNWYITGADKHNYTINDSIKQKYQEQGSQKTRETNKFTATVNTVLKFNLTAAPNISSSSAQTDRFVSS